ncbi:glycosyltransferase family 2 protein, partial [Chloroflexota bacterium]
MVNMRNASTVSVVLPTYNRANTLGRAIQSVLKQTHENLELIVVDDGSTDNTEEVVRSFNDWRMRYINLGENKGESIGRNTGIDVARGGYIAC